MVYEGLAGGGQKTIHGRFVYVGVRLPTFALDSPVVALSGQGHQVYADILAAEVFAVWKIVPKPDGFDLAGVDGSGLEKSTHELFKTGALVLFRIGLVTVFL